MTRPPLRIPTLIDIDKTPWNGMKVASTFSGGGGSCTGYRMAGFRVIWANEFVPEAQATYRANHPDTILDPRDIRTVQAADILNATGLDIGELDLFDGSPPCQLFSTAGKREKGWGKTNTHVDAAHQRASDDLFFEYARLLRGLQPKTFVAENVRGMVVGTAKGYFKLILAALRDAGYRVQARLLDASWLDVAQARERLIFVGVRNDLQTAPVHPAPLPYRRTIREALPYLDVGDYFTAQFGTKHEVKRTSVNRPSPTIDTGGFGGAVASFLHTAVDLPRIDPETGQDLTLGRRLPFTRPGMRQRKLTIAQARALCGFPPDYVLCGTHMERWARLGNAVPPPMTARIAQQLVVDVLHDRTGSSLIGRAGS